MALLVPNTGEAEMLKRILNMTVTDPDIVVRLYTNNYTPIETTVIGDLTDATATGYGPITATPGSWSISGDPTEASHTEIEFIFTDGEPTVYGYFITNTADDTLLWAEEFVDGPYTIPAGGGSIFITPKIQLA